MNNALEKRLADLMAKKPWPQHTLKSLHEEILLQWTYNSNAIEGNTLTLKETKVVLEGITIGGKSIVEHLEAINHRDAINYVEEIISNREELSEWQIKNIHQLVLKNIDAPNAGCYRRENVIISGAAHLPPDFLQLDSLMQELLNWYHGEAQQLQPIERAARLHTDFVKIHPFIDGNGRTARLLLNFELLKSGWLPVVIKASDRLAYYESLDLAHTQGDYSIFIELVKKLELETIELYERVIG